MGGRVRMASLFHEYFGTGHSVRGSHVCEKSRVRAGGTIVAGDRDWREYLHLQRGERTAAAAVALCGRGTAGDSVEPVAGFKYHRGLVFTGPILTIKKWP